MDGTRKGGGKRRRRRMEADGKKWKNGAKTRDIVRELCYGRMEGQAVEKTGRMAHEEGGCRIAEMAVKMFAKILELRWGYGDDLGATRTLERLEFGATRSGTNVRTCAKSNFVANVSGMNSGIWSTWARECDWATDWDDGDDDCTAGTKRRDLETLRASASTGTPNHRKLICKTTALRNSTVRTTTACNTARKTRGKTWATILGHGCVATARGNCGEQDWNSARRCQGI
ncbi:hypothetical protein C8R46DRAFT_1250905 [Mycena filopes]|nr:hypothetical protein C8R46DRAFT_1250905 [Mycena filopes]